MAKNKEFKSKIIGNDVVYVLESMTGGSTGASSGGTVVKAMGGVQRRKPGQNLIAQEADKDKIKVDQPTQRNPVAANSNAAIGGGAMGRHKNPKDAQKNFRKEKHKGSWKAMSMGEEQGVVEDGNAPGYVKYEQMKDKISSVLIKLYNQGKDEETIQKMGTRVAQHLGYDPKDSIFQDAWMDSLMNASLDGSLDQDSEDDYTDYSMRQGELGNPDRFSEQGVAEGAPIVVMPSHKRLEKKHKPSLSRGMDPAKAQGEQDARDGKPYNNPYPFKKELGAPGNWEHNSYKASYDSVKPGVAEGLEDTQKKIEDTINKLEDRLKHAKTDEQWDRISARIERLQAGLKRSKQGVAEEQLEETSPEAIAKINQITRK